MRWKNTNLVAIICLAILLAGLAGGRFLDSGVVAASGTALAGPPMEDILYSENLVVTAAENVLPAVVNIQAKKVVNVQNNFQQYHKQFNPYEDFFKDFFRGDLPQEQEMESRGSGFVFDSDGMVLTNNHVVAGAEKITVIFSDGKKYDAQLKGKDPRTDLAVLEIESAGTFPSIEFGDSENVKVGSWCLAIGNPFQNLEGTVTFGVISAKGRNRLNLGNESPDIQDYIQTDASINPGNSGGPLINIRGEVIGINSAIASPSGGNVGIGFAIPINMAKEVLNDLLEYGRVKRALLGVTIQNLDPLLSEGLGLKIKEGVLINSVMDDSPAEHAGMEQGDVIVEFDNKKVTTVPKLQRMVGSSAIGEKIKVKIMRDGKSKIVQVKLVEMEDDVLAEAGKTRDEMPWLGLTVSNPDPEEMNLFEMLKDGGVIVKEVEAGSPAADSGIRPGMIIKEIEGMKIKNVKDYYKISEKMKEKEKPLIFLMGDSTHSWFTAVEQSAAR